MATTSPNQISDQYASMLGPDRASSIRKTLKNNEEKDFVQRILRASEYPSVKNEDGSYSTHRMGTAEVDGKSIAFPTLFFDKKTSSLYESENPVREALRRGDFISFNSPEEAKEFAENGYKTGFNTDLPQNNMARETALERQKRIAAEENDFARWAAARNAEKQMADEWGGGLINGRPAAVVVPNDPTSDGARQPLPGQGERERAARTASISDPELVARNVDRIRNETAARQEAERQKSGGVDRKAKYNSFLRSSGINPNTIGGAFTNSKGGLDIPTISQQEEGLRVKNRADAERSRMNIAARRLEGRNPEQAAELRSRADRLLPRSRSFETNRDYYMGRYLDEFAARDSGMPANGFGRAVDFNSDLLNRYSSRI